MRELDIDLVLTAHPTEVTRRTLIHKHVQLNDCLEALELSDLLPRERDKIQSRIEQLINQAWHTNEIREQRPTPVDEAVGLRRGGKQPVAGHPRIHAQSGRAAATPPGCAAAAGCRAGQVHLLDGR